MSLSVTVEHTSTLAHSLGVVDDKMPPAIIQTDT